MFKQAVDRLGTVHIMVNNAAMLAARPADTERRNRVYAAKAGKTQGSLGITTSHTDDDWLRFWGVNVHGVFYCTRAALRLMEPKRYGKIINIRVDRGHLYRKLLQPVLLGHQSGGHFLHQDGGI